MAILFADSFDLYGSSTDMLRRWDVNGDATDVFYEASSGRFGGGAVKIDFPSENSFLGKAIPPSQTMIFGGSFFYPATNRLPTTTGESMVIFKESGSVQVDIEMNGSAFSQLKIGTTKVATSTIPTPLGRWTRFEIKVLINSAGGNVTVKFDGVEVINFTGDTQSTATSAVDFVSIHNPSSGSGGPKTFWDDVVIMDDTGATNNDFIGDIAIETVIPDGDSAQINFTPTGAGTTNSDRVDDGVAGPDDDTTYVESLTVGHKDRYSVASLTTSNISAIAAVQNASCMKKDSAGTITAAMVLLSNVTESVVNTQPLSTDYAYVQSILETDPDTAVAWTESGVNAIEIGQTVVA